MATGSLPHLGESARDTLTKRLTEPPRPLAEAAPESAFPEGLQAVITRVLARRPAERYATAGAFGTALVELFTGPLEIATMPTVRLDTATAPVPQPTPRRRGVMLAVGSAIGAATIAAIVIFRPSLGNSGTPVDSTPPILPQPQPPVALPPAAAVPPPPPPTSTPRDTSRTTIPATRPGGMRPVNPPPESLRIAPPPPSGVPSTPVPTEKDVDALDVADDGTRDADRAKAVQFYNRLDAGEVVRAKAAFVVAGAYNIDKRFAEAERWIDRAIAMNDLTEPGPQRTDRASRYRNMKIAIARMMTSDTTGP
jgi:hypothetical protein